jgi:hypothetical protein
MLTNPDNKKRELRAVAHTVIAFAVIMIPLFYYTSLSFILSFTLGYIVSLANILISIASLRWGFSKTSKTFYKVVWGGMLLRLAAFCIVLVLIYRFTHLPVSGFLIAFVLSYIYLQYQEIRLVNESLNKVKS